MIDVKISRCTSSDVQKVIMIKALRSGREELAGRAHGRRVHGGWVHGGSRQSVWHHTLR